MTCRHCQHLDVTLDKLGRRRVRTDSVHRCTAPEVPRPIVPCSVEAAYDGFKWPPDRSFMRGDQGDGCPLFKLHERKRKEE